MELLYIWIKDYKNIRNQGFNFSPRWQFSFNSENNELDIEDRRKSTIKDFFGDDITNVSAIVGKNGVGKSQLLHEIGMGLAGQKSSHRLLTNIVVVENFEKGLIQVITKIKLTPNYSFNTPKVLINGENEPEFEAYSLLYSNNFDFISSSESSSDTKHFSSISSVKLFSRFQEIMKYSLPKRGLKAFSSFPDVYGALNRFELTNQILLWLKFRVDFEEFGFLPAFISISGSMSHFPIFSLNLFDNIGSNHEKKFMIWFIARTIKTFNYHINFDLGYVLNAHTYEIFINDTINEFQKHNTPQCKAAIELINKIIEFVENGILICEGSWDKASINLNTHSDELRTIVDIYLKTVFVTSAPAKSYEDYYLDFKWGGKDLHQLSTGEQFLTSFLSRMYYQSKQINEKNIVLLLDEVETGFHPEWQKKYITVLKRILPKIFCRDENGFPNGKKLQIIVSSHSPFVISDLPKGHVVFLDKDKDHFCEVIADLHDKTSTFGANIHTLLSDGFFLDSLVSDFADKKINEVIIFLNGDLKASKLSLDYAQKVVSMIGEPIVRRHLQKLIYNRKTNNIELKIKRLQKEIDELKKHKENG